MFCFKLFGFLELLNSCFQGVHFGFAKPLRMVLVAVSLVRKVVILHYRLFLVLNDLKVFDLIGFFLVAFVSIASGVFIVFVVRETQPAELVRTLLASYMVTPLVLFNVGFAFLVRTLFCKCFDPFDGIRLLTFQSLPFFHLAAWWGRVVFCQAFETENVFTRTSDDIWQRVIGPKSYFFASLVGAPFEGAVLLRKLLAMPINIVLLKFAFNMLHEETVGHHNIAFILLTARKDYFLGILFELLF